MEGRGCCWIQEQQASDEGNWHPVTCLWAHLMEVIGSPGQYMARTLMTVFSFMEEGLYRDGTRVRQKQS